MFLVWHIEKCRWTAHWSLLRGFELWFSGTSSWIAQCRPSNHGPWRKHLWKGRLLENHDLISVRHIHYSWSLWSQGGFVDCKCNWGLFRDRNVTLRKPKKIHHGMDDLSKKGLMEEFDNKKTFDWWVPGSKCDEVGGQDASTLPPLWTRNMTYDFFTPLMCRRCSSWQYVDFNKQKLCRLKLTYEKDTEHAGLETYRFLGFDSSWSQIHKPPGSFPT